MITEESIMQFGKYKGKPLNTISDIYLKNFLRSNHYNGCHGELKELLDYLETKYGILTKASEEFEESINLVLNMCPKEVFTTESDARYRLKYINSFKSTHKLPQRVYQYEKCGFWHLTSKEDRNYAFKSDNNNGEPIKLVKLVDKEKPNYEPVYTDKWAKLMKDELD